MEFLVAGFGPALAIEAVGGVNYQMEDEFFMCPSGYSEIQRNG